MALNQRGCLSAAEIAEHAKPGGRDVSKSNRLLCAAVKKRGLVKDTNSGWSQPKARLRPAGWMEGPRRFGASSYS